MVFCCSPEIFNQNDQWLTKTDDIVAGEGRSHDCQQIHTTALSVAKTSGFFPLNSRLFKKEGVKKELILL